MAQLYKDKKEIKEINLMRQIADSISKKHKKIIVDSDKDYKEMLEKRWKKSI